MTANSFIQLALFIGVLVAIVKPLGWYMARVYQMQPCGLDRVLGGLERLIYRFIGVEPPSPYPLPRGGEGRVRGEMT